MAPSSIQSLVLLVYFWFPVIHNLISDLRLIIFPRSSSIFKQKYIRAVVRLPLLELGLESFMHSNVTGDMWEIMDEDEDEFEWSVL